MKTLFKSTSYRTGAVMAVGATATWKLLSFVNALLIAAYFGAGTATDLYFYIIMVIGFGWTFLQRLNTAILIPEAMTLEAAHPQGGRPLLTLFFYLYAALGGVLMIAAFISPVWLGGHISRFSLTELTSQRVLLTLGLWLFALQVLATYLQAILEMYHRFASTLLAPLNAILPLVCLLVFGPSIGIASMLYGFVASYLVQTVLFIYWMKRELHWQFALRRPQLVRRFVHNMVSNQLLEAASLVGSVLPIYLLSGLSAGLVSALTYAKQLADSTTEVFTQRVANLSKIQLTENIARGEWDQCNHNYLLTHFVLWFLLTPLTVFSFFYAQDIIVIFFKRGAFTLADAQNAAAFLRPLLLCMLLVVPILMQNNIIMAGRKVKEFLYYGLLSTGLFIVLVPLAMYRWGAFAFLYTQLGCYVASLAINAVFLRKHFPQFTLAATYRQALRIAWFNLLALVPAVLYGVFSVGQHAWPRVFTAGVLFVSTLAFITYKSGDLHVFLNALKQNA